MSNTTREDTNFASLKRQIVAEGLLVKDPFYYGRKLLEALALFAVSAILLQLGHDAGTESLSAVALAVTFTQIGFIGHDAGHRQIFDAPWKNDLVGLVLVDLVLGFGYTWWVDKHQRHHRHPNRLDHDPDVSLPWIRLSTRQLRAGSSWFHRLIVSHQALLFFPFLVFLTISLRWDTAMFLLRNRSPYRWLEVVLLWCHVMLYGAGVVFVLGIQHPFLFIAVHQACLGLFLGSAFAANHKGMPMLDAGPPAPFLWRQVVTTRNLRPHHLIDFWYGPLACQIEHHLFPQMPRCNLRKAARLVRAFCVSHDVPYHETGVVRAYVEILRHLRQVSAASLRAPLERS
jgi:fatty acid desaturase